MLGAVYLAPQAILYKATQNRLEKMETVNGLEHTINHARDELSSMQTPLKYVFIPGPTMATYNYIKEHTE